MQTFLDFLLNCLIFLGAGGIMFLFACSMVSLQEYKQSGFNLEDRKK